VLRARYLRGLTFLALVACHRAAQVPLPDTDRPLALLAKPTLAGPNLDPHDFAGKVVVVNIWSPGCVPCAHEAPGLQKIADELGPKGLELVTVMMEGTRPAAQAFVAKTGLRAPVVLGDDAIAGHFHLVAYPLTVVLGRDGKPEVAVRGSREPDQFRELFAKYL